MPDIEVAEKPEEPRTTPIAAHFNVGGTKYEVSRSLMSEHPDTMLARIASETWQKDPESVVFVGRDGARFGFVLDYMRDGQVSLPAQGQVTKESLLKELLYFGFSDVEPSSINVEFTHLGAPSHIAGLTKDYEEKLAGLIQQSNELNLLIACTTVAHACCVRYMTTGTGTLRFATSVTEVSGYSSRQILKTRNPDNELDFQAVEANNNVHIDDDALNRELAKYGLFCSSYVYHMSAKTKKEVFAIDVTLMKL